MSLAETYFTAEEVSSILDVEIYRVRNYGLSRKIEKLGNQYIFKNEHIEDMRRRFKLIDQLGVGRKKRYVRS